MTANAYATIQKNIQNEKAECDLNKK